MKGQPTNHDRPLAGTIGKKFALPSFLLLAVLFGSLPIAHAAIYNFQLQGPNIAAEDAVDGNVIAMTGAGNFDTCNKTVAAGGAFTVYDSEGKVISKGTWTATDFNQFLPFESVNRGFQTGELQIYVEFWTTRGSEVQGGLMTVFCEDGEVPGPAEADSEDGITVAQFTERLGGFTLFQLVHPDDC